MSTADILSSTERSPPLLMKNLKMDACARSRGPINISSGDTSGNYNFLRRSYNIEIVKSIRNLKFTYSTAAAFWAGGRLSNSLKGELK